VGLNNIYHIYTPEKNLNQKTHKYVQLNAKNLKYIFVCILESAEVIRFQSVTSDMLILCGSAVDMRM